MLSSGGGAGTAYAPDSETMELKMDIGALVGHRMIPTFKCQFNIIDFMWIADINFFLVHSDTEMQGDAEAARKDFVVARGHTCNGRKNVAGTLALASLCFGEKKYAEALGLCVILLLPHFLFFNKKNIPRS